MYHKLTVMIVFSISVSVANPVKGGPPTPRGGNVESACSADLNESGPVNLEDLKLLLEQFGPVPPTVISVVGNFDTRDGPSTSGSIHESWPLYTTAGALYLSDPMTGDEDLTIPGNDLYIYDGAGGYLLAFEGGANAVMTVSGIRKGGLAYGSPRIFAFSAEPVEGMSGWGRTMNDLVAFLSAILGLDDSDIEAGGGPDLGGRVFINEKGQLVVEGNRGSLQDMELHNGQFIVTYPDDNRFRLKTPLVWEKLQEADGASVKWKPFISDSFCKKIDIQLTYILQHLDENGASVIWIAETTDADGLNSLSGAGWLEFDASGAFVDASATELNIVRHNGARNPSTFLFAYGQHHLGLTVSPERRDGLQVFSSRRYSSPDLNSDGWVDSTDLALLISQWDTPRRIRPIPAREFPSINVDDRGSSR